MHPMIVFLFKSNHILGHPMSWSHYEIKMVPNLKGEANARIIPFKIKDNTFNHSNVSNHIPSLQRSAYK